MIAIDVLLALAVAGGIGFGFGFYNAKSKFQGKIGLLTEERDSARAECENLRIETSFAAKLLEDKKAQPQ